MANVRKFFIEKMKSEKGKGEYLVLKCDLGYRVIAVTFDSAVITEVSGLAYADIFKLKVGDKLPVEL